MEQILEKILLGAIGGLIAYWMAHRKFVSQRWWDKRFDLYSEVFDILKQIEHSLAIFEWAVANGQNIENSEIVNKASTEYETGLSHLAGIQCKMLLVGLDDAHLKLLTLSAALQVVHPSYLSSETDEKSQEIFDLIRQSKRMLGECSLKLALQGKVNLKIENTLVANGKKLLTKISTKYTNP